MTAPAPAVSEEPTGDKEKLEQAISLLRRATEGYKISDKCQCVTCQVGKFLNEIV